MSIIEALYFAGGLAAAVIGWFIRRYVTQQDRKSSRHYESLREVGAVVEEVEQTALDNTNARRKEIDQLRQRTDDRFEAAYETFPSTQVVNMLISRIDRLADRMERLSEIQMENIRRRENNDV